MRLTFGGLPLPVRRLALALLLAGACAAPAALDAQTSVSLADSTVQLTGPWKFHTGDDPAWAEPGFDDSHWGTMDLTPPPGSYDLAYGFSGWVPGWTARGYPGYSGYAWYRLRVNVESPAHNAALAIEMPNEVDDGYQVYADGRLIGEFGRFTPHGVTVYNTQPRAFALPAGIRGGPVTFAIRMWMDPSTPLFEPDAGGLHNPPILGLSPTIAATMRLEWSDIDRSNVSYFAEMAILLLAMAVAFGLFRLDSSESAYLWLGLSCLFMAVYPFLAIAGDYTRWMSGTQLVWIRDVFRLPIQLGVLVLFWAYWFRLERVGRWHRIVWPLAAVLAVVTLAQRAPVFGSVVPVGAIAWLGPLRDALRMAFGVLMLWIACRGFLKDRAEALLAFPAVLLVTIALYSSDLVKLHVTTAFFPFGIALTLEQASTMLFLCIITVFLVRRFLDAQRVREQWRLEIEQARQVQQVLIPEAIPPVPGFAVESEYRPAQQVGGDFFQIIPGADGSVLAIIGDVSGKGLRAAMLVSLIVGAARTMAEFTRDPAEVLRGINERLCGRLSSQFATCLALHIAPDGAATVANAGHIPPYWNGRELALAGSIPLGMVEDAPIEETTLHLEPGDRLILLTDGIVEAQNKRRELFGFSRLGELALRDCSSVEIATAAQEFGQEDDITVLRIQRVAADAHEPVRSREKIQPLAGVMEYS